VTHVLNSNDFYGKHMYENCKVTKGMKSNWENCLKSRKDSICHQMLC